MSGKKIVVIGEILVEIMADTIGDGFREAQPLTGPFPSGAPAIFADQVARIGQPVALISAVGDDDFGRLNLDRLGRDGVDVSGVFVDTERPTGSAFVRYRGNGDRDFVFNIGHSAAGRLNVTDTVEALMATADHLHVTGSSLSSPEFVALNLRAAESVRSRGGTVSFDPNLRREILSAEGMPEAMSRMISMTDLYLPSGDELTLLTGAITPEAAIEELLGLGVQAIVHKRGAIGASFHCGNGSHAVKAFPVDEVDPTGAGDCFGGTFTALWLRGMEPREALRLAAASGALAVTRRGPMEGTATLGELEAFARRMTGAAR
ncbi:MAG: sugar kinase [Rhodobacter sp.]|nr:sugar kinase [Rhodobacter sp.]